MNRVNRSIDQCLSEFSGIYRPIAEFRSSLHTSLINCDNRGQGLRSDGNTRYRFKRDTLGKEAGTRLTLTRVSKSRISETSDSAILSGCRI